MELGGLHHPSELAESFLEGFQTKADGFSNAKPLGKNVRREALGDCIEFVTPSKDIWVGIVHSANACQLLLGVPDADTITWERQESDLVVLPNRLLSVSLLRLLNIHDRNVPVYHAGAFLFHRKAFCATGDFLSSTPLEAAYVWTLAVHLADRKSIAFPFACFNVEQLVDIIPHRLFSSNQVNKPDIAAIQALRKDVLYYAAEKGGLSDHHDTHPWADLWFRTTSDQVVLIDISGGQNAGKHARGGGAGWIASS